MKTFHCDACGNLLFFENFVCLGCQRMLGFIPELIDLCTLEPASGNLWKPLTPGASGRRWRPCQNGTMHQACNWWILEEDENPLCRSCRLNQVIPDLSFSENLERWRKLEAAKRRMMYSALRLKLPTEGNHVHPPLRFQLLADTNAAVLTGHANGLITINIAEADDAERERRRVQLHEPYRTLLGHIRHEVAHYYWQRLVEKTARLDSFRRLFGDEREDYAAQLRRHYQNGPAPDWSTRFVSAYASVHPWEDWAETAAHYFHITDTLETAASFGLSLRPHHPQAATMRAEPKKLDEHFSSFDDLLRNWLPITHALNELNRGMGLPDLYPFVLSGLAVEKLKFVHEALR